MVEPLEETRTELIFATEPVLSSLHLSIPGSFQYSPLVELDEVEVCSVIKCGLGAIYRLICFSMSDTKRHSPDMQRAIVSARIRSPDPQ